MKKLILFEGPDCAGKTTLIESIKTADDVYIHNGLYPSQQAAIDTYIDQFEFFGQSKWNSLTLVDRAHWSEQVYGSVIRDTHMLIDDWTMLENKLIEIKAITVLCLPPYKLAAHRWSQRNGLNEEFVTKKEQYSDIYNGYTDLKGKAISNVIEYDYSQPFSALSQLIKEITHDS